jgi:hypothetical protein
VTAPAKPDPLSVWCPFARCKQGPGIPCGEMGPFEWGATKRPHPSRVRLAKANTKKQAWVSTIGNRVSVRPEGLRVREFPR